ncbi:S8 family peptidase [Faucicola boevrei]|uniref:S8 family peptidase n=1 Tax=Faucicola boevrei TaxID=346665 RepID=UPI000370EF9A|nr:S8 family serine peptidase [Moraxella boevrei]
MRKLKLAVLVSALSMACVAQAELTPSETFKQLSPTAVDKLKVSNIDVNALLKNNSNDLMVELSETAYPKITTAEKQGLAVRTFKNVKEAVLGQLSNTTVMRDYYGSATLFLRVQSRDDLVKLLNDKNVVLVRANTQMTSSLRESLPFINQIQAIATQFKPSRATSASRFNGEGSVVGVLDTGLNHNHRDFGDCSRGFNQGSCRVVASLEFAAENNGRTDGQIDDGSFHGTNVAGVVAGVAPAAKIAALDVFAWRWNNKEQKMVHVAPDDALAAAYNWMRNNHSSNNQNGYNIVAANLSLGGGGPYQSETSRFPLFTTLKNMGVASIIATGNEEMSNGIAWPASERNTTAVGAVFEADYRGSMNCHNNPNFVVRRDGVTCFSNSGRLLDFLAPGFNITAGGITMTGTSQATPHVAGAVAVLRAPAVMQATNNENVDATMTRLADTGVRVRDYRNGVVRPRINLLAAVTPIANANPVRRTTVTPTRPTNPRRSGSVYYDYSLGRY